MKMGNYSGAGEVRPRAQFSAWFAVLLAIPGAWGQTSVDAARQVRNIDFSGATITKPIRTGNLLPPGTCASGEMFYVLTAPNGQGLYACQSGAWAAQVGPASTMASQTGDLLVVKQGSALVVGAGCSAATPCNVRFGHVVYSITNPASASLTGAGTGFARVYLTDAGTIVVDVSSGAGVTVACSNCATQQSSTPQVPGNAIALADVTIASGAWGVVTDKRAFLSAKTLRSGTGIVVTDVSGEAEVAIDTADVPRLGALNEWSGENDFSAASLLRLRTGAGAPPAGECAALSAVGRVYVRTNAAQPGGSLFICANTEAGVYQWEAAGRALTAGANLAINGQNQIRFNPLDLSAVALRDEFLWGASGLPSSLPWQVTGALSSGGADAQHPGVVRLTTASAADSQARFTLGGAGSVFANTANWETVFVFRLGSASGQYQYRAGLFSDASNASAPGVWARLANSSGCADGNGTDTVWSAQARDSTGSSSAASTVSAAPGDWVAVRLRSLAGGGVGVSIARNGAAFSTETTLTANVPDTALYPALTAISCSGTPVTLDADFFGLYQGGLTR